MDTPKFSKEDMKAFSRVMDDLRKDPFVRCSKCKGSGKLKKKVKHSTFAMLTCPKCKGFKEVRKSEL